MTNEEILREIGALSPEGRRLVENFVACLRQRSARQITPPGNIPLPEESFIGMWQDRDEMADSTAWVRGVRESEWGQ